MPLAILQVDLRAALDEQRARCEVGAPCDYGDRRVAVRVLVVEAEGGVRAERGEQGGHRIVCLGRVMQLGARRAERIPERLVAAHLKRTESIAGDGCDVGAVRDEVGGDFELRAHRGAVQCSCAKPVLCAHVGAGLDEHPHDIH